MNSELNAIESLAVKKIKYDFTKIYIVIGYYNLHIGTKRDFLDRSYTRIYKSFKYKPRAKMLELKNDLGSQDIYLLIKYKKGRGLYYYDEDWKLILTELEFKLYLRKSMQPKSKEYNGNE